jgi:purine-binding chemotaxis protein CheW
MADARSSESSQSIARQLLRLACGRENLVVPIDAVREILEVGRLTPLPQTPDFVHGVMNLRGSVVPVVDLNARFGFGPAVLGRRSAIVVVETSASEHQEKLIAGLLVDAVYEVLEVDEKSVEPVPTLGVAIASDFLAGMVNIRGRYAPLLNLNQVLAPETLAGLIGAYQTA